MSEAKVKSQVIAVDNTINSGLHHGRDYLLFPKSKCSKIVYKNLENTFERHANSSGKKYESLRSDTEI